LAEFHELAQACGTLQPSASFLPPSQYFRSLGSKWKQCWLLASTKQHLPNTCKKGNFERPTTWKWKL